MWQQVAISGMKQSASWVFKRKSNKGVKTLNLFYDQYGGSNNNIMVFLMLSYGKQTWNWFSSFNLSRFWSLTEWKWQYALCDWANGFHELDLAKLAHIWV